MALETTGLRCGNASMATLSTAIVEGLLITSSLVSCLFMDQWAVKMEETVSPQLVHSDKELQCYSCLLLGNDCMSCKNICKSEWKWGFFSLLILGKEFPIRVSFCSEKENAI
jgi:hypothetical protein